MDVGRARLTGVAAASVAAAALAGGEMQIVNLEKENIQLRSELTDAKEAELKNDIAKTNPNYHWEKTPNGKLALAPNGGKMGAARPGISPKVAEAAAEGVNQEHPPVTYEFTPAEKRELAKIPMNKFDEVEKAKKVLMEQHYPEGQPKASCTPVTEGYRGHSYLANKIIYVWETPKCSAEAKK